MTLKNGPTKDDRYSDEKTKSVDSLLENNVEQENLGVGDGIKLKCFTETPCYSMSSVNISDPALSKSEEPDSACVQNLVLGVEPDWSGTSVEGFVDSRVDCGVVPCSEGLGNSRVDCEVVPCFERLGNSQVDWGGTNC